MHVSIAVLMMLVGFRASRWIGTLYAIFAVLIMLGSVHLAWHYAVDGYLAAALTILIWKSSGRIVRWWSRRADVGTARSSSSYASAPSPGLSVRQRTEYVVVGDGITTNACPGQCNEDM
jgi:hypothetical protein